MFKDSFKYYKSRNPPPDLKHVIDVRYVDATKVKRASTCHVTGPQDEILGLKPIKHWKLYRFFDIADLIIIQNPFTRNGQRYWITKCLRDYSRKPYVSNLDAQKLLNNNDTWWDVSFGNSERAVNFLPKLRWSTLGYHHNWETKRYTEETKTDVPFEICDLTQFLARTVGFENFKAEAAIINYYRMNSTLAGHTDHSELNIDAPLISLSFGQSAIFLIGGLTLADPANALLLRSGDILIMFGASRLRHHGVPKILQTFDVPWARDEWNDRYSPESDSEDWLKASRYISEARINLSVRQVLKTGQITV
ncbi:nucleic acid dioxygenase ALKBH1 isoform X2 [Orussus abietinus]|uniref:nucleic acid dioxygenase ALKBH1 isoform X2 n=1 Tax=Orussus abietinus TaxID=222816 RepID=UPI000625919E|nr:nucleic acid dioxygenase ALKBH1 isoform X2 [Orussus abietinus]